MQDTKKITPAIASEPEQMAMALPPELLRLVQSAVAPPKRKRLQLCPSCGHPDCPGTIEIDD